MARRLIGLAMSTNTFIPLLEQIALHPRIDDLARLATDCVMDAANSRDANIESIVAARCRQSGISDEEAATPVGNVIESLKGVGSDPSSATLVAALVGRTLAKAPPQGVDAEDETAGKLVRAAAWTGVDVMAVLDEIAPDRASALWGAIADAIQRSDAQGTGTSRADALVAASLLVSSNNDKAKERRSELASAVRWPVLARVLGASGATQALSELRGELAPIPRGPVATFFLGLTGWLVVSHIARLIARVALQYRRPAEVRVTAKGVVVRSSTRLLGKVLRESENVLPLEGLVRATREVRFPRAATYAGLLALAFGSYVGVSWLVDGVRASSFSLAAAGILVMALGIALDFVLLSLLPGRKGTCRLVLVPKRGGITCVGGVDIAAADAVLRSLSGRA